MKRGEGRRSALCFIQRCPKNGRSTLKLPKRETAHRLKGCRGKRSGRSPGRTADERHRSSPGFAHYSGKRRQKRFCREARWYHGPIRPSGGMARVFYRRFRSATDFWYDPVRLPMAVAYNALPLNAVRTYRENGPDMPHEIHQQRI